MVDFIAHLVREGQTQGVKMARQKSAGVSKISVRKRTLRKKSGKKLTYEEYVCYVRDGVGKPSLRVLGRVGSDYAEVTRRYAEIVADAHAGTPATMGAPAHPTMEYMILQFLGEPMAKKSTADYNHYRRIAALFCRVFADVRCDQWGPDEYRRFKKWLVAYAPMPTDVATDATGETIEIKRRPWSRQYLNKLLSRFRTILSWGTTYEYYPDSALAKIRRIKDVEEGDYPELVERPPVEDVPDYVVAQTLPYLPPTLADAVRLAKHNALRPSEICGLKVGDIDTTGEVWITKKSGKTTRHGILRITAWDAYSRSILARRCKGKTPEQYVISPRDAMRERWEERAAKRKSKKTPSATARDAAREPTKYAWLHDYYTPEALCHAVAKAIERANKKGVRIAKWYPYQLRHAGVTDAVKEQGIEAARVIASHKSIKMTDHYNHSQEELAIRYAEERDKKAANRPIDE